jgi:hypothetical protein
LALAARQQDSSLALVIKQFDLDAPASAYPGAALARSASAKLDVPNAPAE